MNSNIVLLVPFTFLVIGGICLGLALNKKYLDKGNYSCPKCGKFLNWSERLKFSGWNPFVIKGKPCPHCQTEIAWKKWPMLITDIIVLLYISYAISIYFLNLKFNLNTETIDMVFLWIFLLSLFGLSRFTKFVIVKK